MTVQSPPGSAKAAEARVIFVSITNYGHTNMTEITQPLRFWNVQLHGFDNVITIAATPGKARWATFRGVREAGYYDGRDGFSRFLSDLGRISEITMHEAHHRVGDHKPVGAPRDWAWELGITP